MNDIGKLQLKIIRDCSNYLQKLKKKNVDIAVSPLCFFTTWAKNPGNLNDGTTFKFFLLHPKLFCKTRFWSYPDTNNLSIKKFLYKRSICNGQGAQCK